MKKTAIGQGRNVSNDGKAIIECDIPYRVSVALKGVCPMLFHRWSCEGVEAKSKAKKGSAQKKTDDVESYVYRCKNGHIGLPGSYLVGAIINAAKFRQDPRSPRKSAADIYKAGIVSLTDLADLGKKDWDFLDQRRAIIQRNAITRVRPAMLAGWTASFFLLCNLPGYISPSDLNEVIAQAGLLVGLADFRPSHGRFQVTSFEVLDD